MKNNPEHHNILFHNRAVDASNNLFREFKASSMTINRLQDENVFQQQLGKYINLLKHRLDGIAIEMMSQSNASINKDEWHHSLSAFIQDYIQEFRLKAKSL